MRTAVELMDLTHTTFDNDNTTTSHTNTLYYTICSQDNDNLKVTRLCVIQPVTLAHLFLIVKLSFQ